MKRHPINRSPVCSECPGRCCSARTSPLGRVVLEPWEADLPRFKPFVQWARPTGALKEERPYLSLKPACPFLDKERRCSIYRHRPASCKTWVCYHAPEVMKQVEQFYPTHRRLLNRWKVLPGQPYGIAKPTDYHER